MPGKLSIVATPIGNLEDITLRALRVLKEADVIYCEDTRVTSKLLQKYAIRTPLKRLDANVEATKAREVIERLARGERVAYVTDAGTPGISDPGARLVAAVREYFEPPKDFPPQRSSGLLRSASSPSPREGGTSSARPFALENPLSVPKIESVPGPSALTAALSVAGVNAQEFWFLGFLPHKKGRLTVLKRIAATDEAVVLYESSHRIFKLLEEFVLHIPERRIVIVREITKLFEEVRADAPSELQGYFADPQKQKGEFVVIIEPRS